MLFHQLAQVVGHGFRRPNLQGNGKRVFLEAPVAFFHSAWHQKTFRLQKSRVPSRRPSFLPSSASSSSDSWRAFKQVAPTQKPTRIRNKISNHNRSRLHNRSFALHSLAQGFGLRPDAGQVTEAARNRRGSWHMRHLPRLKSIFQKDLTLEGLKGCFGAETMYDARSTLYDESHFT